MKALAGVLSTLAVLTTGGMAGIFFAFSVAVMPGLDAAKATAAIASMQSINQKIQNPVFLLTFVGAPLFGPDVSVVVTVSRSAGNMLGDGALRARYRLTTREIQVARLLACRHSSSEIAETLGVSVHTARRHTERVLMKLGVHARGDVASKLRAGA